MPDRGTDPAVASTVAAAPAGVPNNHGLSPGTSVGRIRILRKIGQGGMGEVWLGRDELLGRDVAVKVLAGPVPHQADSACAVFLRGARAAASLAHPGLNRVLDAGVVYGSPYLVLELLDGQNLAEVVSHFGRLELPVARAVIGAIAAAVAELHRHDLVHRDIKPSNVVLTTGGDVVVTDFGLACARPALAIRADAESVAGTPQYMAPEMFDGAVSARTDVYAIGLTAYYLLCGREPFEGQPEDGRRRGTQGLDTRPLRAAGIPQAVVGVVERAASANVLFRPKSARHLRELFETAFVSAAIACASGSELVRLVHACSALTAHAATPPPDLKPLGIRDAITEFAAERRRSRGSRPPLQPQRDGAGQGTHSDQIRRRLVERGRVRFATALASVVGTAAGFLIWTGISHAGPRWNGWLTGKVGPTSAAVIAAIVGILSMVVGCVGVSALLYRFLRGLPLPELAEHARCGWCRHDLRGISQPVCPECGHTIGDRGPDEQHEMPPGFRARRGMPFLVPAFFPVAIVFFSFPVGILVYLLVPGSHGSLRGSVLELAVLLLSLAATLTFYEAFLQFILAHSGRCWCSACGVELRDLREPVCPACGQRI